MRTIKRKKSEPTHISSILGNILSGYRACDDINMLKVWDVWDDAVRQVTDLSITPAVFKENLLIVYADTPGSLQTLHYLKQDIIDHINNAVGEPVLKDIRFKIGEL